MKIVHCNHFNYSLDDANSSYSCYQHGCEVKMFKMFLILAVCIGGAYEFGYLEGETNARKKIFGESVKKVDRKRRRY